MKNYIDTEKMIATLETRIAAGLDGYGGNLKWLLENIGSLQQEQPEVEFEKEYAKFSNEPEADFAFPIDLADYKDFALHFFELGLNARKL